MPELHARHLSKHFAGILVVKDVDLVIRPGEIVGYLAPTARGRRRRHGC